MPLVAGTPNSQWSLIRSPHFEVFSQAGEREGRAAVLWLEQLHRFFLQTAPQAALDLHEHGPVRVIGFRSAADYARYQLRPAADAYSLSGDGRRYIVLPRLGSDVFGIAAHEYTHLFSHSLGLQLPEWLAEGMAELFSTVRIGEHGCSIGGDLPMRSNTLRQRSWLPLAELLAVKADSPVRSNRNGAELFYAESWALTDMLVFSPRYTEGLPKLMAAIASGDPGSDTLTTVYAKPSGAIQQDLRAWIQTPRSPMELPGVSGSSQQVKVTELTGFESRLMIAELLLASSELKRAESAYQDLVRERPDNAAVAAALGTLALRKGDRATAREQWRRATELGIGDSGVCYQYAVLAEEANLPREEIATALRRAIELKPDFDDARYRLGLLENGLGQPAAALEQLRSMKSVPAGRAYGYWTAMASVLTDTGQREQAKEAAGKAMQYANTLEERISASRLAYIAATDLTVQVSRDANGNLQMVTARKPHGSDAWNPFVEPGDHILSLEGQIRKVECRAGTLTGFRVAGPSTSVEVLVLDPNQILIRGGTAEFVCEAEDGRNVVIQYAASSKGASSDGVLRGLEFR